MPRIKTPLTFALIVLWSLSLSSCSAYQDRSSPIPEELGVLQAAVDTILSQRHCDYISVGRAPGTRQEDIPKLLLDGILTADGEGLEKARALALDFWVRNSSGLDLRLSGSERRLLGQKGAKLGYLTSGNRVCTLQLSQVGWSGDHQRALVCIWLREGSLSGGALLELERGEEGWRVAREWVGFDTITLD